MYVLVSVHMFSIKFRPLHELATLVIYQSVLLNSQVPQDIHHHAVQDTIDLFQFVQSLHKFFPSCSIKIKKITGLRNVVSSFLLFHLRCPRNNRNKPLVLSRVAIVPVSFLAFVHRAWAMRSPRRLCFLKFL